MIRMCPKLKKKRNKDASMQKIMNSALNMIRDVGYSKTTTNRIAEDADVSIALVYKYFPKGKPDILLNIMRSFIDIFDDKEIENIEIEKIPEFLKKLILKNIKQHRKFLPILNAIAIAALTDKETFPSEEVIKGEMDMIPIISKILTQSGYNDKISNENLSRLFLNIMDSLIHRHLLYGKLMETDVELADFICQILLRYVGT